MKTILNNSELHNDIKDSIGDIIITSDFVHQEPKIISRTGYLFEDLIGKTEETIEEYTSSLPHDRLVINTKHIDNDLYVYIHPVTSTA